MLQLVGTESRFILLRSQTNTGLGAALNRASARRRRVSRQTTRMMFLTRIGSRNRWPS
jgi:hypothetical protein